MEVMAGMGNTNFTMVMPTVQSFSAGGWSGGREARIDYGTRSFGCNRDLCPFQVRGGGGVRLASSSLATAIAHKLTIFVASRSSACPWMGSSVDASVCVCVCLGIYGSDGGYGQYQLYYGYAHRPILQSAIGGPPTRVGGWENRGRPRSGNGDSSWLGVGQCRGDVRRHVSPRQ